MGSSQSKQEVHSFGPWLRGRRSELGLTQAALAERAGCARDVLRQFEAGVKRPSLQLAGRLADALGIPAAEREAFILAARGSGQQRPARAAVAQAADPRSAPQPQVALIGRDTERSALPARLRAGGQRLITLAGPGGVGKTSLALQVAADLAADPDFAADVVVVPLALAASTSDAALAITEALGGQLQGGRPAQEQLVEALSRRAAVLVLDNCEHLLGPEHSEAFTGLIRLMLDAAPGLRVLATSRERLRLRDERVVELGGLALPAADSGVRVDRADAVRLFVERAQRGAPGFTLGRDNRAAVAQICRRLEGLPLAIELAASWTRVLAPHEIAGEIERSLDFLAAGERDAPPRHRSMRAALDHSWQLLSERERAALARLSIFRGGFDRSAAHEVGGAPLPDLAALVDKSLLQQAEIAGAARYTLHELVRQYAAERLSGDTAEQQATAARHAAFYSALLQRSIAAQTGGSSPGTWANLMHNIDNLRAAWMFAAHTGDTATILAMARNLMILFDIPGRVLDGAALFERAASALRSAGVMDHPALAITLGFQGYFLQLTRPAAGAPLLEEAVALLEEAGETTGRAQFLLHLGTIEVAAARFAAAHERYALAHQLAVAGDDQLTRLWAIFFQGVIALYTGDIAAAERHLSACLDAWRSQGFTRGIASALNWLSEVYRHSGRLAAAQACAREGLQISSTAHDTPGVARSLRELGALALDRRDLDDAQYLLTESCATFRSLGGAWVYGRSRSLLVRLEVLRGDHAAAQQGCAELLRQTRDGAAIMLPEACYGLALLLRAQGESQEALAALYALGAAPGEHATLALAGQLCAELEQRLDPAQRAEARQQARDRPLLPWMEDLCARPAASAAGQLIVPPGGRYVAETGEVLSPREVEVLRLLARGAGNAAIAEQLIISTHTVKRHVSNILQKLRADSRSAAAARAQVLGLLG